MSTKYPKTILFISIGVLFFVIFGVFGARRVQTAVSTQKQHETLTPTTPPGSLQVFRKTLSTPQDSLTAFQKSDVYRTIINNNLFRPLGWTPPRPREPYHLLGTLIPTNGNTPTQAIIQNTATKKHHIVTTGDNLNTDTTLTDIQPKQVTLETAGQKPRILTLNPTPWIK